MKFLLLLIGAMTLSFSTLAQFESKAVSDAKKYFSGYSTYEYSHKTQKIFGIRVYYRCTVEAYKNAGFKCYPSAKLQKSLWVEYWSNGELKDKGTWLGTSYEDVPNPNHATLTSALKSSFDPIEFFDSVWLWDLLEIHGFQISTDMSELKQPIWTSEKDVKVYGSVTASVIQGCCDVKKYKFKGIFKFTSEDCGKSFKFVDGYQQQTMYNKDLIEEKTVSQSEGVELQKKTIGRAAAEGKAKEEWDALVNINIPDFDNEHEFAAFVYQIMTSGAEEEVKSLLYKTLPSYKFMEGSKYLLDWSAQEYVAETLEKTFRNNGTNVQTNFCPVINRYKNSKNSYIFHDKIESKTLEIRTTKEEGKWKVKEFKIWLADGLSEKECTPIIEYETVKNDEFGFNIDMPKGYSTKKTDKAIILEHKINGVKYVFAASIFGDGGSNEARKKQSDDNTHRHLMNIHSLDEKESDWEMNGVKGREVFFLAENTKYERYKTIYLGLNFTETDEAFFNSFKCDGKGGGARENLSFSVGDPCEIHVGAGRYEKGNVTAVNPDGTYDVKVPNMGKTFTAPIGAMREDPTGIKSNPSGGSTTSSASDSFRVGDAVLVRVSQTDWKSGIVKEDKGDGKYRVEMNGSGDQYIQPSKNLKPDPNAQTKGDKKRKIPGIKLR